MKKSEILSAQIEAAENTSLAELWQEATGDSWEENIQEHNSKLGLFYSATSGDFLINPNVTFGNGWKNIYEQQNNVVFIGWIGENELLNRDLEEMLNERIQEFEELEYQEEQDKARYE